MKALEMTMGVDVLGLNDNLSVYPNPSNGEFTINIGNETMSKIHVFDISGKLVFSDKIVNKTENHTLNLSYLTNGIYILKLSNNEYTKQTKLVINK